MSLTLLAAMVAAPLALIVLFIDVIAGRWLSARVRCWLWVLVAVRLVLPIAPESPLSTVHLWRLVAWSEHRVTSDDAKPSIPEFVARESALGATAASPTGELARSSMADILVEGRKNILPDLTLSQATSGLGLAHSQWGWEDILGVGLVCVWVIGAAVVLLRAAIASMRFAWNLRSIREIDSEETINVVLRACGEIGVRRPLVKQVPGLQTPALFGVWQPTLCLPEAAQQDLDNQKLRLIVLHEAMHIRRGDGYLACLLTLVRAIHWFNPIAWCSIRQIENYRELACDEAVRRFAQPREREMYGNLLLRYAAGRPAVSLGLLGLCFARPATKSGLARRLKALTLKDRRPNRFTQAASFALVLLIVVVGLTDAASTPVVAEAQRPELPVFSVSEPSAWDVLLARAVHQKDSFDAEAIETREYDLTEALRKVDDVPPSMTATDWLLLWAKQGGPSQEAPAVRPIEGEPNRFAITTSRNRHQFFDSMLAEVIRMGHVGQVVVSTRVLSSEHVEKLIDADWLGTIKYAAPEPVSSSQWAEGASQLDDGEFSLSMEAVSFEYAPYTAFVIDEERMDRLVDYFQANARTSIINAPKVTLFSGQSALISDESLSPFLYGVEAIVGEHATALQPNIAVIPEGLKVDLQALVLDDDMVDLRCRLTLSSIDGVAQATLPGAAVTVQTPRATRRTVNVQCRLRRGETLLVAPLAGQRSDGKKTHYYAISAEQILLEEDDAD
ncbi:MAG: hypothetical protein KDA37_14440 [Planctomycetales bacterium]|nr:hypothetical protein [Planctomycetales bacterium]